MEMIFHGCSMTVDETLTYYAFPNEHWRRIRTNNPLERLMREIRRRTRVVGAFPDGQSALNLATARFQAIPQYEAAQATGDGSIKDSLTRAAATPKERKIFDTTVSKGPPRGPCAVTPGLDIRCEIIPPPSRWDSAPFQGNELGCF
jgi:hypothetical protein